MEVWALDQAFKPDMTPSHLLVLIPVHRLYILQTLVTNSKEDNLVYHHQADKAVNTLQEECKIEQKHVRQHQ
jgi:hypothetical protein